MTAKTGLFAVTAAAAIVTFAADGQSRARRPGCRAVGPDQALKIMTSAKLPIERFTDYSVIFN